MHILHDDILPTYAVLKKQFPHLQMPFPVRIIFSDHFGEMPYDNLYTSLTQFDIIYLNHAVESVCFEQLIVGFDRSTLWYQYGFHKPQGPTDHDRSIIRRLIHNFTEESSISKKMATEHFAGQITLFTREDTRRILNQDDLSMNLAKHFRTSVKMVNMEIHSLEKVITEIGRSKIIIGVHGAMLATVLWASENTTILELFPYAIVPSRHTPYKTLANIMGLRYISWSNIHMSNTVGHLDYPRDLGGLQHMSELKRQEIMAQVEVPPHLCCEDPSWLYHIYQDTIVDIEEIVQLLS